jgi:hypothetical protein
MTKKMDCYLEKIEFPARPALAKPSARTTTIDARLRGVEAESRPLSARVDRAEQSRK